MEAILISDKTMDVDDLEERIEEYRHKHESKTEWNLRKAFMLTHRDKYPMSRLLCFSACFINYECYGCAYPGPVMVELKELMEEIGDILEEHRSTITQAREMQFVKSSGEEIDSFPIHSKGDLSKNNYASKGFKRASTETVEVGENPSGKKQKMSFVKASDSYTSTDVGEGKDSKSTPDEWRPTLSSGGSGGFGGRKPSVLDSKSTPDEWRPTPSLGSSVGFGGRKPSVLDERRRELLDKFYMLKTRLKECLRKTQDHPVSALHMAANWANLTVQQTFTDSKMKGQIDCRLQMDYVDIATATEPTKKKSKMSAHQQAISEFMEPYLKIEKYDDGTKVLKGSQVPFFDSEDLQSPTTSHLDAKTKLFLSGLMDVTKLGQSTSSNTTAPAKNKSTKRLPPVDKSRPIEEFLILEHHNNTLNPSPFMDTNILKQSADFNRMSLDYDFRHTVMGESRVQCLVSLQGIFMAEVEATQRQEAKHLASTKCMEILRQMCWTIQIKQAADSEDLGLSREEVLGDIEKTSEVIPESNIGNKLLKAMGWKGGGVGKKGTGIAEPINVESVINREGLGLKSEQGISRNFLSSIRTVAQEYASSSKQNDLVFSPDFSKDERASIHKICQQFGLKTRSHGTGTERYLVASRRRTPHQLFNHIMESGGETSKYVLVPPGQTV